jgi:hypothetical protein
MSSETTRISGSAISRSALTAADWQTRAGWSWVRGADGGAVDVLCGPADGIVHRGGDLGPGQVGQVRGEVLDLREEVAVPGVDERDGTVAIAGEQGLLLDVRLLQVEVAEQGARVGGLAEPLDRDEGQVFAGVAGLGERQRGGVGVAIGR